MQETVTMDIQSSPCRERRRARKHKETIRFNGKEYTLSEIFVNHSLTVKYLRRMEGCLKRIEIFERIFKTKMSAEKEEVRGHIAIVRAHYLNGSKPVTAARA